MSTVTVTADISRFRAEIRELGDRAPLASARALNRTMGSVQTATVRALSGDLHIAQKFVRRALELRKATRQTLRAELEVTGARLPLIAFNARGPEPSRGKGRGVTYDVGRGRGRVASGFITTVASSAQRAQGIGHRGVFKRKAGAGRTPIVELRGPSLPHVFVQRRIADARQALAAELFVKNMGHEVEFLVRGLR